MPYYDFKDIVYDSSDVLLLAVGIGTMAGYMLDVYSTQVTATVLAMVPPINGIGGNIGSILGARLSSALHMGTISPKLRGQSALKNNLFASVSMGLILFLSVGIVFFGISLLRGYNLLGSMKIALIFSCAGMLLVGIIAFISLISAILSYRRGMDPDNVVIPVVTTLVDLMGIISLLTMVNIIGV